MVHLFSNSTVCCLTLSLTHLFFGSPVFSLTCVLSVCALQPGSGRCRGAAGGGKHSRAERGGGESTGGAARAFEGPICWKGAPKLLLSAGRTSLNLIPPPLSPPLPLTALSDSTSQGCDLPEQSTVHVVLPPAGSSSMRLLLLQERLAHHREEVETLTRLDLSSSRLPTTSSGLAVILEGRDERGAEQEEAEPRAAAPRGQHVSTL